MQVDVRRKRAVLAAVLGHQAHEGEGFLRGRAFFECAVGVDGVEVPALKTLVRPGADAGHHQQVGAACKAFGLRIHKAQCAVHAAGFVAVHAAGHQHAGQAGLPVAGTDGAQRESFCRVLVVGIHHVAIQLHIKPAPQCLDGGEHVVGVAALAHLARAPLVALCGAPGLAGRADGIGVGFWHGCVAA
ncbi:hypothetical protein D3C72_1452660 [compost metagenome]